jgi:predicted RNase H-like nuclease
VAQIRLATPGASITQISKQSNPMSPLSVLGIDAAWGTKEPSGVALVKQTAAGWRCVAVAPSYGAFIAMADGTQVDWSTRHAGGEAHVDTLLAAATRLAGTRPSVVCADIPLSLEPIHCRRAADEAVSKAYGKYLCAAHSPSAERPGEIGSRLRVAFAQQGYPLATTATLVGAIPALVESYPHPAIGALLGLAQRLEYKISKSTRYWPGATVIERRQRLLDRLSLLHRALAMRMGPIQVPLPPISQSGSLSELKRYEDALDAVVCCWVGMEYIGRSARPHGDGLAAIWCPTVDPRTTCAQFMP